MRKGDYDYLPPVLEWEFERTDDVVDLSADAPPDAAEFDTRRVEVERDRARQTLQDIFDAIEQRSQYYVIDEVVLGVERYVEAEIYCRLALDTTAEAYLGVDVTVVPGDLIEPVIPTSKRVEEHAFDDS